MFTRSSLKELIVDRGFNLRIASLACVNTSHVALAKSSNASALIKDLETSSKNAPPSSAQEYGEEITLVRTNDNAA